VLQPNYRGSDGFGQKWFMDGRQQWGGVTYTDIQDATKWAVAEGIADPKKICILGTGFGGYEALLSVARTSGVYACAVSINGITDLASYQDQGVVTGEKEFRRLQIGSEKDALKRDSPTVNAAKIDVPVLLVHGTKDWVVQMDQTKAMEDALDGAGKDVTVLMIKNAGHELERKSDRVALLTQLETFLKDALAP
jgi:dipeptidyl aminopeptidase/acylaminoacyl peptidase